MCRNQPNEFAGILDAVERATVVCARSMQEKIRGEFTIESADRRQAAVTVEGTSDGESWSFIVIRSATSNDSATDSHPAQSRITSFHLELAAIGRSRMDKARASAVTTGSDQSNHVLPPGWGRGVEFCGDRPPADRRAVAHTHPRNKISRFN